MKIFAFFFIIMNFMRNKFLFLEKIAKNKVEEWKYFLELLRPCLFFIYLAVSFYFFYFKRFSYLKLILILIKGVIWSKVNFLLRNIYSLCTKVKSFGSINCLKRNVYFLCKLVQFFFVFVSFFNWSLFLYIQNVN